MTFAYEQTFPYETVSYEEEAKISHPPIQYLSYKLNNNLTSIMN